MKLFISAFLASVLIVTSVSVSAAPPHPPYHPPAPSHPPVRPPTINRPPTLPNQQILQQRRLRAAAQDRLRATTALPASARALDDKVGSWEDFANLSESELATLFAEMTPSLDSLDANAIKAQIKAGMAGSGAPPELVTQLLASVDGLVAVIQIGAADSLKSYPADMAKEFKRIYSANCCSEAQFIQALGAAETNVTNKFRADVATMIASPSGRSPSADAMFAAIGAQMGGGTTVVTYSAGDPAVQAARTMVGNGRGAVTQVASNNTGGGATPPAPAPIPAPPAPAPIPAPPAPAPIPAPPAPAPIPAPPAPAPIPAPPAPAPIPAPPAPAPIPAPPAPAPFPAPPAPAPIPAPVAGPGPTPSFGGQPSILGPVDFGGGPLVVNDVGSDIASIAIPQTDAGTPPRDGSTTAADVVISGSMILIDLEEQRDQLVQDIKANPDDRDDLMDQLKDISGQAEELRGLLNDPGFLGSDTAGTILTWTPYVVDGGKIIIVAVAVVATTAACGATAGAACVAAVTAAGGTSLAVAGPLSGITGNSIANYNNASAGGNGGAWTAATSVASAVGSQIIDEGSKMVGGKIFGELGGGAVLQMIGGLASNETVKFIIVEVNSSRGGSTSQASLGSYSSGYHAPGSTSTASNGATVHH